LARVLATRLDQAVVPIDEFVPAMHLDHPRPDVRARFPAQLTAVAFDPPIVLTQPPELDDTDSENTPFADW
jgi:collagen beta-1,O-galactosyltransferase